MTIPTGQKAKMLAGELYLASDPELVTDHLRAQAILARFNTSGADEESLRVELLRELFGHFGDGAVAKPNIRCDYGYNISIGSRSFINYDCVLLDCNRITIGEEVQIAPGVHIYTGTHPVDARARRSGLEYALPVIIGNGVWLGGGVIICPDVTIGENTVVGAGSVVTHSLPGNVVAAGNPCRVIHPA
jgi:maltose O-acetyltransferase